jgi:cell fate regulator YaaT (PSP1 superfamily)
LTDEKGPEAVPPESQASSANPIVPQNETPAAAPVASGGPPAAAPAPASPDERAAAPAAAASADKPAEAPSPPASPPAGDLSADLSGVALAKPEVPATADAAAPAPPEASAAPIDAMTMEYLSQTGASPSAPAVTETDKPTAVIRYGAMGLLGRFICTMTPWRCGQRVVIKSDRGQEMGFVVCAWGGCGAPGGVPTQIRGEVLRAATHADEVEERHLRESERREFVYCKQLVAQKTLPMKMAAVEHLFGGDRIIFYFVSETRVDFRALVRDLAHEFQTRIEMRQIGVRDEARLLGDYERCGRPLCCRAWIRELEPVSMKMAKIQKATLDPAKISGRCGRLMCCLRFEHATYRDLARNLPRKNTLVVTTEGPGKVVDTDVVSQMVGVLLGNGNRINVPVESLVTHAPGTEPPPVAGRPDEAADADAPVDMVAKHTRDAPEATPAEAPSQPEERPQASEAGPPAVADSQPQTQSPRPNGGPRPNRGQRQNGGPRPDGGPRPGAGPGQEQRGRRRRRSRRGGRNRGNRGGGPGGPGGGPGGPRQQGGSPPQAAPPSGS